MEIIKASDLVNLELPTNEWLIKDILPKDGLVIIAGKPGDTKSFLILWLTCCLASGSDFMGYKCYSPKEILYIDEENSQNELIRRLKLIMKGMDLKNDDLEKIGILTFQNVNLGNTERMNELKKIIQGKKPGLVIIDSLVRVLPGDENSAKDTKVMFEALKKVSGDLEICFLIIHHSRKKSGQVGFDDVRGSGDIVAAASHVYVLNKHYNRYTLTQCKSRYGPNLNEGISYTIEDIKTINDEEGIVFKHKYFVVKNAKSAKENAYETVSKWVCGKEKGLEFKSGDVYGNYKKKGSAQTNLQNALKELGEQGVLESIGKGKWKIPM